ncbi:MAG TPA: capreomycidine synthase [Longimicrobium sp.]|nr:capreomycidine synthase [Longimicrobium sp.]
MRVPPALLEHWMRQYYFAVEADLGSSGVEDFPFGELRALLGLGQDELDALVFQDSQTLGGTELREALARRFAGGRAERVMATHGSTEANFLLMHALLKPGDEVVALKPIYPQLATVAAAIGCTVRPWRLRPERGWRPDVEEGCALITPRTRMVIVNFPHNPTGATLTPGELDALVGACDRVGAWLAWDAAFAELAHDAPPLPDPALRYERAVSMGTLSKAYGLPGLRVGWAVAEPAVLDAMVHLRDYTTLHLSPLVELVARRAVERGDRIVERRAAQARRNRDAVDRWIAGRPGAVSWTLPEGGACGFPRLHEVPDVEAFCHRLAREHRVLLVPGTCFGVPGHVRLGFGRAAEELEAGLERLAGALEEAAAPALV